MSPEDQKLVRALVVLAVVVVIVVAAVTFGYGFGAWLTLQLPNQCR